MERRQSYLLTSLNKWDSRRVFNVVREGEFLTASGRLFQVSAEAWLKLVCGFYGIATKLRAVGQLYEPELSRTWTG